MQAAGNDALRLARGLVRMAAECSVGYFGAGAGLADCSPCEKGSYQPSKNATTCFLCPAGFYAPTPQVIGITARTWHALTRVYA